MRGPGGKNIQILPFFGASVKATPPTGPAVTSNPIPATTNTTPSLFQGLAPKSQSNSQTNPPASGLSSGPSNIFTSNSNTPNLFSGTNTSTPSLFGNPLAKASSGEFSQTFLNKAATGLFGGQGNLLFSQASGNSLFSGQSNGLFPGQNTGSLFGSQSQQQQ